MKSDIIIYKDYISKKERLAQERNDIPFWVKVLPILVLITGTSVLVSLFWLVGVYG